VRSLHTTMGANASKLRRLAMRMNEIEDLVREKWSYRIGNGILTIDGQRDFELLREISPYLTGMIWFYDPTTGHLYLAGVKTLHNVNAVIELDPDGLAVIMTIYYHNDNEYILDSVDTFCRHLGSEFIEEAAARQIISDYNSRYGIRLMEWVANAFPYGFGAYIAVKGLNRLAT
jgi:hypothetical protein